MPAEHGPPTPKPSSTVPLQSSSTLLHNSGTDPGGMSGTQTIAPALQLVIPGAQGPGRLGIHTTPDPGLLSSTVPLQSSSTPLHVSGVGCPATAVQVSWPLTHFMMPLWVHAPTPA